MTATTTLRGSLDDLPLDGVVRLLAANRTSGVLTVSPNTPIRLLWADGRLLVGSAGSAMALGRYALASGLVSAAQLEELFGLVRTRLGERQARSLDEIDVLEALADHVPVDALREATRRQCTAALTEAALLPSAHWYVDALAPHPLCHDLGGDADELLATVVEHLRDWDRAGAAVGGDAGRLRRVPRLSPGVAPVSLSALDWSALAEADGQATVGQIAHRLGIGRYESYATVRGLAERGLVELLG